MTLLEFIYAVIGTLLSGVGLFGLYVAWKSSDKQALLVWGCWAAIALALVAWAFAGGKDRGLALGAIVIILQALLFVCYQAAREPKRTKPVKPAKLREGSSAKLSVGVIAKRIGSGIWVSLGCGLVAFLVAMGIHELFWQSGVHASNALVFAFFLFPIIWALISAFSFVSRNWKLKLGVFAGLTFLSVATIMVGN